jgi:hypothetical protein
LLGDVAVPKSNCRNSDIVEKISPNKNFDTKISSMGVISKNIAGRPFIQLKVNQI